MAWWFFQRFQQCSFSALRQHVHFVENENTMPPWVTKRRVVDELANVVDTVIARGI